jgi:hypothetical protein
MAHLRKIGSSTLIVSNITAADPAYLFLDSPRSKTPIETQPL